MELKVGDKVRFLNEKGGGIVTGLISTTMVNVAIEEGFEVPIMASDLIKIDPAGAADRFFDRKVNVQMPGQPAQASQAPASKHEAVPEPEDSNNPVTSLYRQSGAGITEGMYLIYTPHDQKWLVTGSIDIYVVNNTAYDAVFSFMLEEENDHYSGVIYEVIPPWSKILIETITREDLDAWSNGIVQVLFHNQDMQVLLTPLHSHFKIKSSRFYKETSYQEFMLTGGKSIVINLGDIASQKIPWAADMKSNVDLAAKQKIDALSPSALIDKHRTGPRTAEVDLHISALRNDYSAMAPNDILLYQVDYFSKMLESAIAFNYLTVVFIHGIGNGILKSAIINKLKDYESLELRKASFAQYGNGAIEVVIHTDHKE